MPWEVGEGTVDVHVLIGYYAQRVAGFEVDIVVFYDGVFWVPGWFAVCDYGVVSCDWWHCDVVVSKVIVVDVVVRRMMFRGNKLEV